MANFRYLRTFIDEDSVAGELPRSRSCPDLQHAEQDHRQHEMATYVVNLWQRAQTLTGGVAHPVDEDTESEPEAVLPEAPEAVAAEADMLTEGQQETPQGRGAEQ